MIDITKYEKMLEHFGDGKTIFEEGEPGKEMYIIGRGEVEIRKKTLRAEKILMTLKMGDVFGEMALIDNTPRSATAVARGQTVLIVIDETTFDSMVLNNPQFALKLIKILSKRLRNSNQQIFDLVTKDRKNHLIQGLVEYAKNEGHKTFKGLGVNIKDFTVWANTNLGYSTKDIEYLIRYLIKKEILLRAASTSLEVIVPDDVYSRYR